MSDVKRHARIISEREIAIALVLELANSGLPSFALMGFYDDDAEFIIDLANRLNVFNDKPFHNKLTKVVRNLVKYGVLHGKMYGTHKEYIGEPTRQMEYMFVKAGKIGLLTRGESEHTGSPEWEAGFLIRRAYPDPERDA